MTVHSPSARADAGPPPDAYATLFEHIDEGFCIIERLPGRGEHPEDYLCIAANPAAQAACRIEQGRTLRQMFPAEPSSWFDNYDRVLKTGQPMRFEHWFSLGAKLLELFAFRFPDSDARIGLIFRDVTAHRRAEQSLHRQVDRQEFLLALSDALRPLDNAADIQQAATRLLAERVGAARAYYAECNPKEDSCIIQRDYVQPGATSRAGIFRMSDYEPVHEALAAGQMVIINDTLDPGVLPAAVGERYAGGGVRAQATVPLVKNGRLVATLSLSHDKPRAWTPFELSLLRDTAERTWSAIMRACAEVALCKSEMKYRSLIEAMDQGYVLGEIVRDAQGTAVDYRFLEANPAWLRQVGLAPADVVGRTRSDLFGNSNQEALRMFGQALATNQAMRREFYVSVLDRWYDVHVLPRSSDQFAALFDDISLRKSGEAKLAFLADLSEAINDAASESEIVGAAGQRLGAFLGLQRFYLAECDHARGTADIGHAWQADELPAMPAQVRIALFEDEGFARALGSGKTMAVRDVRDSGHSVAASYEALGIRSYVKVPLRRDGQRSMVAVVAASEPRDWTCDNINLVRACAHRIGTRVERVRAELALRQSEMRFRALAEASPALIWQTDQDGQAVYLNQRYLDMTGLPAQDLLGKGWQQAVHPDDLAPYLAAFEHAQRERRLFRKRVRLRDRAGAWHWLETSAKPWSCDDGRYLGMVGISIDVTEAVLAEEALREADRRKDEFLATLAHELRNPLAPISNAVQLLRQPDGRRRADHIIEMVGRQVRHIIHLVDDLMDVSRITRGKIELGRKPVPLSEAVSAAVEISQPAIDQAGLILENRVPDQPLYVEGDRVRLAQVFANLLGNAAKFTGRGGRITLAARRDGQWAVLKVADTGAGIDPAQLPRVFDMFVQAECGATRSQGGLGIGLTMVRRLVEMHGGRVDAFSAGLGQGSEFIVRLPLLAREAGMPGAQPAADTASLAGRRVLIVDDNRDAADSLCLLLSARGADARSVYDGAEGLAALDAAPVDVLVLDIGMPAMNGHEVAQRVRAAGRHPGLCIVALTGWGQQADRQQSQASGFDHHLTKPVDVDVLGKLIAGCRPAS